MKVSMLLLMTATSFAFIQPAAAGLPSFSTSNSCFAWAQKISDPRIKTVAIERCEGLQKCNVDSSNNKQDLRLCYANVEQKFLMVAQQASPSTPLLLETPSPSVKVNPYNSDYAQKGGRHKGWSESEQP